MKRRELTDDELNNVIRLRQAGSNWMEIQRQTLIGRHIVRRAYEDWERKQWADDLRGIRLKVAQDDFEDHIDKLTTLAESLVNQLDVPSSPEINMDADKMVENLWYTDIFKERRRYQSIGENRERETRRNLRRNRLLFESLQNHTRQKVRWEALSEWKRAWDNCFKALQKFTQEARQTIVNFLNQESGLIERIEVGCESEGVVDWMVKEVMNLAWQVILRSNLNEPFPQVHFISVEGQVTEATVVAVEKTDGLKFSDAKLGESVKKICNQTVFNICKGEQADGIKSLVNEVNTMKKATEELEEALETLKLRPLILQTRCDLCPA